MASSKKTSNKPAARAKWMWNSKADPFSKSEPADADWHYYSDVENMIIEEASAAHKTHAVLDGYHIDFKNHVQISNNDVSKQRPVRRKICGQDETILREDRFLPNPIAPDRPFGDRYGFISPYIKEIAKHLNITRKQLPSKNQLIVPTIVDQAIHGIIEEGKKMGKQTEAEKMVKILREKRNLGMKEVWRCCAYLYTLESFLYKRLNEVMRLIGSEQHAAAWRSTINTLGPFCLLLWDNPFNTKMIQPGIILYRGANVPDHMITSFTEDASKTGKPWHSFQAFTSCSRNRRVAESFGNVLLIMKAQVAFAVDLSSLSEYPQEEEELLFPGVSFTIDRMEYEEKNNKYLIYLTLQQRHDKFDLHQVGTSSTVSKFKHLSFGNDRSTSLRLDRNDDLADLDGYDDDWD
uniref:NAD(P)(+)--arginine ADP-ribosyltransferase n=1 Tax=Philodina roseola TaxID=96448 RepID=B3G4P5_PHIRO|nr:ADP-ribosyltransferase-like protein [Philodina roseola]